MSDLVSSTARNESDSVSGSVDANEQNVALPLSFAATNYATETASAKLEVFMSAFMVEDKAGAASAVLPSVLSTADVTDVYPKSAVSDDSVGTTMSSWTGYKEDVATLTAHIRVWQH